MNINNSTLNSVVIDATDNVGLSWRSPAQDGLRKMHPDQVRYIIPLNVDCDEINTSYDVSRAVRGYALRILALPITSEEHVSATLAFEIDVDSSNIARERSVKTGVYGDSARVIVGEENQGNDCPRVETQVCLIRKIQKGLSDHEELEIFDPKLSNQNNLFVRFDDTWFEVSVYLDAKSCSHCSKVFLTKLKRVKEEQVNPSNEAFADLRDPKKDPFVYPRDMKTMVIELNNDLEGLVNLARLLLSTI